jgi:glycosyltransferase involved in cell wall biosynthesis
MRLLMITNTFPPAYTGGAEVSNYHTCRELIHRGIECSILFVNARMPEPVDTWYELDSIPVHRVNFDTEQRRPIKDIFDWRVYRAVRAELQRLTPDLVHITNVSGATLAPYVACRTVGIPVVNTLHDLWLLCPNNMLYRRDGSFCDPREKPSGCQDCFRRYDFWGDISHRRQVFAALTSNVHKFISPSQALINQHVRAGYNPSRFKLIRYGFEEAYPKEVRHPGLRDIVSSAGSYRTMAFVGGGIEIKGAGVLLRAIPLMLRHIERLRVVVAGTGEMRYLAQFRRYEPAVRLLGRVPFSEVRALFAVTDLTVVPSVCHENSPVVIYENYQVGTPVVGSAFGGIPELIDEGKTGYLFPVHDASILAEKAILHFARPAHERRRMRWHCLEKAKMDLTMKRHIKEVLQVYHEVLNR